MCSWINIFISYITAEYFQLVASFHFEKKKQKKYIEIIILKCFI